MNSDRRWLVFQPHADHACDFIARLLVDLREKTGLFRGQVTTEVQVELRSVTPDQVDF